MPVSKSKTVRKAMSEKTPKKKIDLKKEAAVSNDTEVAEQITDEMLRDICPKEILAAFKKCKTAAARADFLYAFEGEELKEARDKYNKLDTFAKKLRQWFIQEFDDDDAQGVVGKFAKLELKPKEVAIVEDWDKFYGHIKKKGEFDLLNKAVNQKAVQERWENEKEIPGVGKFNKKTVSLTKKGK